LNLKLNNFDLLSMIHESLAISCLGYLRIKRFLVLH